jgi:hypothetical protein
VRIAARAAWVAGALCAVASLYAFQREFRVFESLEPYDNVRVPTDANVPADWIFGRLMFPSSRFARFDRWGRDWREGGTSWTEDYPRSDRHFVVALRRLTRVNVRSVEQPVNPDDGNDIFNWPWLYAGLPGNWALTDAQVGKIRDFLLRGGFFLADDFWGQDEWEGFEAGMKRIFPDRPIVELDDAEAIFHTVYDLDDRYQIPGEWATRWGGTSRNGGVTAYWRGIYDDKGRLMVAICANSDLGDSWEWADEPRYPEKYSALGIRIGVDYVIYALTH